jgi:uncharacterized membrane protein HdeD (DUF308 family)
MLKNLSRKKPPMNKNMTRVPKYISGFMTAMAGVFFVLFPETVSGVLGVLWGIVLIVAGIAGAVDYALCIKSFKEENYGNAAGAEIVLVYSIIITILGIIFMIKPQLVMQLLSFVIGVYFIIDGVVKLRHDTLVPNPKDILWIIMIALSVALIVAGIALLINPFRGTLTVIRFSGIAFVISGIESIAEESFKKK